MRSLRGSTHLSSKQRLTSCLPPIECVWLLTAGGPGHEAEDAVLRCRRLAEDGALRAKHGELYAMLDGMRGRVSVPQPTPQAVRSAHALLREAGAQYAPVHALLKVGR